MPFWRDREAIAGLLLTLVMVLAVAGAPAAYLDFSLYAAPLFVVFAVLSFSQLRNVARVFLLLSLLMLIASLLFDPQAWQNLQNGIRRAMFYASFFTALTFIRDAALHSRLVRQAGETITRQKPGRQYVILAIGSHLFGVMMNFGSIGMLGTMIRRSISHLQPDAAARLLRHSMMALLRGFSATSSWSPMSLTPLVVVSILPGMTWERILPFGLASSLLLLLAGWLVHAFAEPELGDIEGVTWESRLDWRPILGLITIVGGIFVGILLLRRIMGSSISEAVIVVLPAASLVWMLVQCLSMRQGILLRYGHRIRLLLSQTLSNQRTEIIVLATAGFIGGAGSGLLPYETMGQWLRQIPYAYVALPLMVFWLVLVLGYIGVNPVITVSVIGTLIAQPEAFGIEPIFLGMVYLLCWSLTAQLAPFTASNLILASIAGVSSVVVVNQWNRRFALVVLPTASIGIAIAGVILHR